MASKLIRKQPLTFDENGKFVSKQYPVSLSDKEIDRAASAILKLQPSDQLKACRMLRDKINALMASNPSVKPTPEEADALTQLDAKIESLEAQTQ